MNPRHKKHKTLFKPAVISERQTIFAAKHIPYIFIIILIVIAGFIVYSNSFHNELIFDDVDQVVNNTIVRSFNNIPAIFTHNLSYFGGGQECKFYRPIQSLTYVTDYFLWGLEPVGYHITNTLLHIIVCLLLFFVVSRITENRFLSAVITLLYLVHPVHTEAVTYVSGRADSLCVIFLLAVIIFQFKYWDSSNKPRRAIYYLAILISFILALLSKELAVVFPMLWMFTEYCLRNKDKYESLLNKRFIFYLPLILLAIACF